jgi:tryptophan synthase alpha chain
MKQGEDNMTFLAQNRIDQRLRLRQQEGRKALIPFITVGDPDLPTTLELMHALVRGGADIIELGVPFSDPMADGPVIQRASDRAVRQGVGLSDVLETVRAFREIDQSTPIVLMGYANPIEAMGTPLFAQKAEEAGVDGVLIVDYPPEEALDFATLMEKHALHTIFLIAPTTTEARIQALSRLAKGYVYYVSLNGVTGAANLDIHSVQEKMTLIRRWISIPVGVGFGIRDTKTAVAVSQYSDAVIIGSRIVQLIESTPAQALNTTLETWIREIRQALDQEFSAL